MNRHTTLWMGTVRIRIAVKTLIVIVRVMRIVKKILMSYKTVIMSVLRCKKSDFRKALIGLLQLHSLHLGAHLHGRRQEVINITIPKVCQSETNKFSKFGKLVIVFCSIIVIMKVQGVQLHGKNDTLLRVVMVQHTCVFS